MIIDNTLLAVQLSILILLLVAWLLAIFVCRYCIGFDWRDSIFNHFFWFFALILLACIALDLTLYLIPIIEKVL